MSIHDTFKLVRLSLIAAVAMTLAGSEAMAWRGGHYYGGGGYGVYGGTLGYASYGVPYAAYTSYYGGYGGGYGYGGYGGYGYGGYGGYYGGYSIRSTGSCCRIATRIRARRAARAYGSYGYGSYGYGACGGYGCYGGCCGSVCGDPCGCDPCCEATVCCDSTSSPIIQDAPVFQETPGIQDAPGESQDGMPIPTEPTPADSVDASESSALFKVTLPASAKIYVNGQLTRSIGSQRQFVSRGLQPGLHYSYRLRVEFEHGGQPMVRYRTVDVMAGNTVSLDFHNHGNDTGQLARLRQPSQTRVTLHVPEGARVILAGSSTVQQGEHRQYVTTRLSEGELWKDYTIRVELQRDGKMLVREKTLQVEGGQTYQMAFDFNEANAQVAMLTP